MILKVSRQYQTTPNPKITI